MTTYFISDLHLNLNTPELVQGFCHFLGSLEDAETLYILGDFFDAWIGDDFDTPLSQTVAAALTQLSQSGCTIYIMHGNRDFLLGQDFCKRCGAELLEEGVQIVLGNQNVLLLHGDSLCTDDIQYQALRTMLRNPQWQQGILAKSIEERLQIAKQARMDSSEANASKNQDIMDVNQLAVQNALDEAGVTTLIHGHTHRPDDHHWQQEQNGNTRHYRRLVLGDWSSTHGWLIRFEANQANEPNQGLTLEQFKLQA